MKRMERYVSEKLEIEEELSTPMQYSYSM